ncbi:MAG: hypothetical protein ABIS59_04110 [Candidatus Saccharibacteria bacterium]
MLLTVHALTGVALGSVIEHEVLLAPVAFGSHLVLDSVPHFGIKGLDFRTPKGFIIGSVDFAGALVVLGVSLFVAPDRFAHSFIGWLGATLPDLFYIPEVLFKITPFPRFKAFHHRIQWSETLPGTAIDLIWGSLMAWVLHARL